MSRVVKGPRIRAVAYEMPNGLWTYFVRLGEGDLEKTLHADLAWETKDQALKILQAHVDAAIKDSGAIAVHQGGKQ